MAIEKWIKQCSCVGAKAEGPSGRMRTEGDGRQQVYIYTVVPMRCMACGAPWKLVNDEIPQ